jgi:hypothetical protein
MFYFSLAWTILYFKKRCVVKRIRLILIFGSHFFTIPKARQNLPDLKWVLAWYSEFLLEIDLKILLRKTGASLNFKIDLVSLHISPGPFDFWKLFLDPKSKLVWFWRLDVFYSSHVHFMDKRTEILKLCRC